LKTYARLRKSYKKTLKSSSYTTPFDDAKPYHDYRNDEWFIKAFGKITIKE
jgi:hypothetical protein